MTSARFDDLSPGAERSFAFEGPVAVLEARRADEVPGVLDAAQAAPERGMWAVGFVAYDAAPGLDRSLAVRPRGAGDPFADLPLAWFALFERRTRTAPFAPPPAVDPVDDGESPWRPSVSRGRYDRTIAEIQERISAGDTYQVNHTIRLRASMTGDDRGLYRDLCLAQRGAHAAYLDTGRHHVLSASPELFFRIDGDRIITRPMKGTAPRGRFEEEDDAIATALVASPKDRAENAMIVDLVRNDLGRVAVSGTVGWDRLFRAERYETVWQLTSQVSAQLRRGTGLTDVFRALFPGGSVTGAPKVSTMRIIAELEDSPRGIYCGAVGYLAPLGSGSPRADFNIAIRTVVVDVSTGLAEYGVGGGITHDSTASSEYDELVAKARVLTTRRPAFELFESLRHEPGRGFRHLAEHLDRLASSARYFGFAMRRDEIAGLLAEAARSAGSEDFRTRLVLARDGTPTITRSPVPAASDGPVRVALDDEPVDPDDVWLFHKTTHRQLYELRRAKRPDVDDVLLVNTRGEVTESTIANVAVRLEGSWWTPPVTSGLLRGTYRQVLLRQGVLQERPIAVEELLGAEEIALVSSVRGWRAATLVT